MAHRSIRGMLSMLQWLLLPFVIFAQENAGTSADTLKQDTGSMTVEAGPPIWDTGLSTTAADTAGNPIIADTSQKLAAPDAIVQPVQADTAVEKTTPETVTKPVEAVTPAQKAVTDMAAGKTTITVRPRAIGNTLAGNLPKLITAQDGPYLVASDIYVLSGRTVTIESGAVLLFKNFTELHVEGRLLAEGTEKKPIIFSSEFDKDFNAGSRLNANPYDWNGIIIHENGLGSVLSHCVVQYTVYGVNSLTRYIKIAHVVFRQNGRADLTIEGKEKHPVTGKPYSYALTISDAKRDGVPVAVLMDPNAKKRNLLRYAGFSLLAGGATWGVWSMVLLKNDQKELDRLSSSGVTDEQSNLVVNTSAEYDAAKTARDRSRTLAATGFTLAILGGAGFVVSFTF